MTSEPDKQLATMLANVPEKTGKPLTEWISLIHESGHEKHGAILKFLKNEHGMTHGFANLVATRARESMSGETAGNIDMVATQYDGEKAALRPLHDAIVAYASSLGPDVEIAPKKTSVSLRRKKQFALITPATKSRIDLGLALKGDEPKGRLESYNAMCSHRVQLQTAADFDEEVKAWMKDAYGRSG